jgi:hypothetical protein
METWKNIGAFLTGVAALLTALIGFIAYLHDASLGNVKKNQLELQKHIVKLGFVNDPDGWVNLRAMPSVESSILTTLYNGDKVEAMSTDANWIRVKTNQNMVGYIYFDRLEFIHE